jgi:hypothetical protein
MTVAVRGLGFVVDDAYEAGDTISIRAHRVKDLPETGNNFSEQLAISRPVISKTIADLETLVGVRLLHALGAFGLIRLGSPGFAAARQRAPASGRRK